MSFISFAYVSFLQLIPHYFVLLEVLDILKEVNKKIILVSYTKCYKHI